jgi:hypothetical protein
MRERSCLFVELFSFVCMEGRTVLLFLLNTASGVGSEGKTSKTVTLAFLRKKLRF